MKVTIYQPNNPTFHVFPNQTFVKEDYHQIYERQESENCRSNYQILENLFCEFQGEKPKDYTGYSLSIGDIVSLDDKLYVCANVGWDLIDWK